MPRLLTLPPRPAAYTVTETQQAELGVNFVVPADEIIYGAVGAGLYTGFYQLGIDFLHHGVSWNDQGAVGNFWNLGHFVNDGVAVSFSENTEATAFNFNSGVFSFANSGTILAWAETGNISNAIGVSIYAGVIGNDGLIGAYSGEAYATALFAHNSLPIANHADGQIIAEGYRAIAVRVHGGEFVVDGVEPQPTLVNDGLIEASRVGEDWASIGVLIESSGNSYIVNSGIIRGDYAILMNSYSFSPPQHAAEIILNEASGLIEGAIAMGLGDDRLTNAGTIRGDIFMEDGDDVVDTVDGMIAGITNTGFGADQYWGGGARDVAIGGRDDDALYGAGGDDLLAGSAGNDLLVGGSGNDGLYGEGGNDVIRSEAGDHVDGGTGDDIFEIADLTFARIIGGDGFDTLRLPAVSGNLDLGGAIANGRIVGVEHIAIADGGAVVIRVGDLASLDAQDGNLLLSGEGAAATLVGAWTIAGQFAQDGKIFTRYSDGAQYVSVADGMAVTISPAVPGDISAFDAVASGAAAPLPGDFVQPILTSNHVVTGGYITDSDLTIAADEVWSAGDGTFVVGGGSGPGAGPVSLENHGAISAAGTGHTTQAVGTGFGEIDNFGSIEVSNHASAGALSGLIENWHTYGFYNHLTNSNDNGRVTAIYVGGYGNIDNHGDIVATNANSAASGIVTYGEHIENSGSITVASSNFLAGGMISSYGRTIINSGDISVTGAHEVFGIYRLSGNPSTVENSGTINVASTDGSETVGIFADDATIINSGTVSADIAIRAAGAQITNGGEIIGDLALDDPYSTRASFLFNTGRITGDIRLGAGNDVLISNGGNVAGSISAGAGHDMIIASLGADIVSGGDGDDLVYGGLGADRLTGGAGRDVFAFAAVDDSIAGAVDRITDFATGVDRVDLSALAVQSLSISNINGVSTVTAVTANGTLVFEANGLIMTDDIITSAGAAPIAGTSGDDALLALAAGSVLRGLAGADILYGGAGDDTLLGTDFSASDEEADFLVGGAGDDVYYVSGNDRVIETDGGGTDTVFALHGIVQLSDFVENGTILTAEAGLSGNAQDNILIGNDFANLIYGGGGADMLLGYGGDDSYQVDTQADLIFENAGGGTDSVLSTTSFYLYENVENLTLEWRSGAVYGVGNELANQIIGNEIDNLLIGGGGEDVLNGKEGNDSLFGGAGDDRLYGYTGIDYIVGGDGDDFIEGSFDADALYGGDGDDILWAGFEPYPDPVGGNPRIDTSFVTDILVGGAGNDILYGNSSLGDYDLMDGGSGNDAFYVDTPDDLTFEAAGGGTDTVYADIDGAGYYLYAHTENLVLLGDTPFGVGNELANSLTGNAIGNYLLGGAGDDRLDGKGGNDVLFGEGGADTFVFEAGTGGDVIGDFARGTDTIDLSALGFASFAALQGRFSQVGADGAIDLGGGDFIVLHGVTMSELTAGDFILAATGGKPDVFGEQMKAADLFLSDGLGSFAANAPHLDLLQGVDSGHGVPGNFIELYPSRPVVSDLADWM